MDRSRRGHTMPFLRIHFDIMGNAAVSLIIAYYVVMKGPLPCEILASN